MSDDAGPRFLVDLMLMRLGRWLRLVGQDVANPCGKSDSDLLLQAKKEGRTIITRDRELFRACRAANVPCILIRSSNVTWQLQEMAASGISLQLDPVRCTLCNGPLDVLTGFPEDMPRWRCRDCQKIYWRGSHWKRMQMLLEDSCSRFDATRISPR